MALELYGRQPKDYHDRRRRPRPSSIEEQRRITYAEWVESITNFEDTLSRYLRAELETSDE